MKSACRKRPRIMLHTRRVVALFGQARLMREADGRFNSRAATGMTAWPPSSGVQCSYPRRWWPRGNLRGDPPTQRFLVLFEALQGVHVDLDTEARFLWDGQFAIHQMKIVLD